MDITMYLTKLKYKTTLEIELDIHCVYSSNSADFATNLISHLT